jgi:hypothetical protein
MVKGRLVTNPAQMLGRMSAKKDAIKTKMKAKLAVESTLEMVDQVNH